MGKKKLHNFPYLVVGQGCNQYTDQCDHGGSESMGGCGLMGVACAAACAALGFLLPMRSRLFGDNHPCAACSVKYDFMDSLVHGTPCFFVLLFFEWF